jgi:thiol-disulfide isomerase/thioredoxin
VKEKLKKIPWSWVFTLLLLAFVISQRAPQVSKNFALEGSVFPSTLMLTSTGSTIDFPPHPDKPTVALFWAIHCGPCKLEMERIQKAVMKNELAPEQVFAVHVGGTPETVDAHMKKHGFTFPAVVDPDGLLAGALDVNMTPTLFLIAPQGKIKWASSGLGLTDVWRMKRFLAGE